MKSADIRQKFLDYFASKKHAVVASSSLVPHNDSTLLFTNAGMVQFKNLFLGSETSDYTRAVSTQCCVRAGGKHNDLDNVGYTARHHTFFEMLGNFSFGDYFKEEAITMAWDFITNELNIPRERLTVTVHHSDKESENIWIKKIGVPNERVIQCGDNDNFWSMGETGPCGPCTEIFYDHGSDIPGGPPGSSQSDGDRYIEIWNIVFMQYNRTIEGQLTPLPKPSVDTGMGLERLSAVMQGVHNNYETDLFKEIINAAQEMLPNAYQARDKNEELSSLRVIADHIRSTTFLIKDNITPSNEGRGYVLRRIIRRALRHGHKLNMPNHFFSRLVSVVIKIMGDAYPDLKKAEHTIESTLYREEDAFGLTLNQGMKLLEKELLSIDGTTIPGDIIFKLYDTYGFPVDLTADIARERLLQLDEIGYKKCMSEQQERSRQSSKFDIDYNQNEKNMEILRDKSSTFLEVLQGEIDAEIIAYIRGAKDIVVLDKTSFYPEGGGQVGDTGDIIGSTFVFHVENTTKEANIILHHGYVSQGNTTISIPTKVTARIDIERRKATMRHHSATHLLHQALEETLGQHVQQKGSLVSHDRLRFDFSHPEAVTKDQLRKIEIAVNNRIMENNVVSIQQMACEDAKAAGAKALFNEKYGDIVRTVTMGTSFELCGGTHVSRTGDIGAFKIIREGAIASGIRRIEALAGPLAWEAIYHQENDTEVQKNFAVIKQRELEKAIEHLKEKMIVDKVDRLATQAKKIKDINVLAINLGDADAKTLNSAINALKTKLENAVIVLASRHEDSACVAASVSSNLHHKIKAGDLIKHLLPTIDGKGGGKADSAQAGGKLPEKITDMLTLIEPWINEHWS